MGSRVQEIWGRLWPNVMFFDEAGAVMFTGEDREPSAASTRRLLRIHLDVPLASTTYDDVKAMIRPNPDEARQHVVDSISEVDHPSARRLARNMAFRGRSSGAGPWPKYDFFVDHREGGVEYVFRMEWDLLLGPTAWQAAKDAAAQKNAHDFKNAVRPALNSRPALEAMLDAVAWS